MAMLVSTVYDLDIVKFRLYSRNCIQRKDRIEDHPDACYSAPYRYPIVFIFSGITSLSMSRRAAACGRAQLLANFVHELDDAWLGSRKRPGTVPEPLYRVPLFNLGEIRQNPAGAELITSRVMFARSPRTDPPGHRAACSGIQRLFGAVLHALQADGHSGWCVSGPW